MIQGVEGLGTADGSATTPRLVVEVRGHICALIEHLVAELWIGVNLQHQFFPRRYSKSIFYLIDTNNG